MALRVCAGGVSIEQRNIKESVAARVRMAGAATNAAPPAKNARRDHDRFISILLLLGSFAGCRGDRSAGRRLPKCDLKKCSDHEADAGTDAQCVDDELGRLI
jgi:hypothetical protein